MRSCSVLVVACAACAAAVSCTKGPTEPGSQRGTGPFSFVDRYEDAGPEHRHSDGSSGRYYIVETLASGVGLFDYDGDGDLDIYLPSGDTLPEPRRHTSALWRNEGDWRFTDVTAQAGAAGPTYGIGCAAGDFDADGDLDLYVTAFGPNALLRNDDGRFVDVAPEAEVADARLSVGSAFLDFDRDGHLDLYVANYCDPRLASHELCRNNGVPGYCAPATYPPVADALYRGRGDGTFEDVSETSGIARVPRWGMGVLVIDYDGDGWVDIYVANDVSANFLFRNLGTGRFEEVAVGLGVALSGNGDEQGSMGVDGADVDGDGRPDLIVTNYQKQLNAFYRHEGAAGFTDAAMASGLGATCLPLVSWGTGLVDFDLDGWRDLFIANGHLDDRVSEYDQSTTYEQRNQCFRGERSRFTELTASAGSGLAELRSSRGAAFGDIDRDGDIDIVVANSRGAPSLLENEGAPRHAWIALEVRDEQGRHALGAHVTIEAGGRTQTAEVRSGGSYASQSDLRLHFGLGEATSVDRVTVRWPDGSASTHDALVSRRVHVLSRP